MKIQILFLIIFSYIVALSQRQNAIFSIYENDKKFNTNFIITNVFDSAMVYYEVGNFYFINYSLQKNRIYLSDSLNNIPLKYKQASGSLGEISEFYQILRTETFFLPDNANQIEFFRHSLLSKSPCQSFSSSNGDGASSGIDDLSRFRIDIMDAGNDLLLASIDSVISTPINDRESATLSGTEPFTTIHLRDIPFNCKNKNIYLRITTFRDGPSPFGMIIKPILVWINRSALYDYFGNYISNPSIFDSLNTIFRSKLITYLDSLDFANGNVSVPEFYPPNFGIFFADRYYFKGLFYNIIQPKGDTIKVSRNSLLKEKIDESSESGKIQFISVAPSIIRGNKEFYIKFQNNKDQKLKIFITDIEGNFVLKVNDSEFLSGVHTINFITRNIANGIYFINILAEESDDLITEKVYVVE